MLSQEQVQAYVNDGFTVVPGLVTGDEIEEMLADTAKIARGGYPCDSLRPLAPETTDEEALRNILCVHMPHYLSPVMRRYVEHDSVCGALSQIVAAHLPHWDGSVKCMQSMLFVKNPSDPGQAWHQDERYIPTRDRSLTGAWIALDDATVENGCLWAIPESHRSGYLWPTRPHHRAGEWDHSDTAFGFDESKEVPIEVSAGDVVFFNGYLLHCSYRNRHQSYRRVLTNHYMNAWSKLPWRVPKSYRGNIAQLDIRTVVPVAGVDPYASEGYYDPPREVFLRPRDAD